MNGKKIEGSLTMELNKDSKLQEWLDDVMAKHSGKYMFFELKIRSYGFGTGSKNVVSGRIELFEQKGFNKGLIGRKDVTLEWKVKRGEKIYSVELKE
jgi:hypothetical protein